MSLATDSPASQGRHYANVGRDTTTRRPSRRRDLRPKHNAPNANSPSGPANDADANPTRTLRPPAGCMPRSKRPMACFARSGPRSRRSVSDRQRITTWSRSRLPRAHLGRHGEVFLIEMTHDADPQSLDVAGQSGVIIGNPAIDARRILGVVPGESLQHDRAILDHLCHRAGMVEGEGIGIDARPADQP